MRIVIPGPTVHDRFRTRSRGSSAHSHSRPIRLGLLTLGPIYYYAPLYRLIASDPRIRFTAIFACNAGVRARDIGYGAPVAWDSDMLFGYDHVFLRSASVNPFRGSFTALADFDVIGEILRRRFDVLWLHGYNFLTFVLGVIAQRVSGGTVIFQEVQTMIHPRSFGRTLLKEAGLRVLFRSGPAMYVGIESRRWFQHYGIPTDRLEFTPIAVDNDALRSAAQRLALRRPQLLGSFGLDPGDGPVILTVSRLIADKAPEVLLEAFARVRRELRCSLLIVGAGEQLEGLKEKAWRLKIPNVVFAGFLNQTEVPKAYVCADIFALVSRRNETWGLVVNEAMNFGLPVVVSDKVGCGVDLVRDGFSGFVVDSDDVDSLAARLAELVRDERKRAAFGAAGKTIVESWNHHAAAAGVLRAVELAVGPQRWQSATQAAKRGTNLLATTVTTAPGSNAQMRND